MSAMPKQCKDCRAPLPGPVVSGPNFGGVLAYACTQCGILSANEVEDIPQELTWAELEEINQPPGG